MLGLGIFLIAVALAVAVITGIGIDADAKTVNVAILGLCSIASATLGGLDIYTANTDYTNNAEYVKAGIEQSIESGLTDDNIDAARKYNKWAKENNKPEIQYLEKN